MLKKIYSFDFYATLFYTPEPEEGKKVFKRETGIDWPHKGWWSKKETLDQEIFYIPINEWVYKQYLNCISEDSMIILATGRIEKLRNEVESILSNHNLVFDEVHLNPGMDTYLFKQRLFERLIDKHKPDLFTMYDDRVEHLIKFKEWAKTQTCQIDIIDINRKIKI